MKSQVVNNYFFSVVAFIVILAVYVISQSLASSIFLLLTLIAGYILIFFTGGRDTAGVTKVFLLSFIVICFFTVIQWLGNDASILVFSDDDNDQFKFWSASQRGASVISLKQLYQECIIDNVYLKNGGYYLYVQTLAFFATKYLDGNHLLLQHFGTAIAGMLSPIFVYQIVRKFCLPKNIIKYSIIYMLFTPILLGSIVLSRDAIITFFYLIIIYLWVCKEPSILVILLHAIICVILVNLRLQHGLFALIFVVISIITSKKKVKYVYIAGFVGIFLVYGITMFDSLVYSVVDTFTYYGKYTDEFLESVNSGLGRYVYMLPTPIKEIAQMFFLQLQFPSWGAISDANNIFHIITGIQRLIINVFWFYIFCYVISALVVYKIKPLPKTLLYGLILFFIFLLLNSSALELRRVTCVYPIMFAAFVYEKDYICKNKFNLNMKNSYMAFYIGLWLVYFFATSLI